MSLNDAFGPDSDELLVVPSVSYQYVGRTYVDEEPGTFWIVSAMATASRR